MVWGVVSNAGILPTTDKVDDLNLRSVRITNYQNSSWSAREIWKQLPMKLIVSIDLSIPYTSC